MPIDDDDALTPPEETTPKALRDAYEKLKGELAEARKANEALAASKRQTDIAALLTQHEAPAKLAKYALRDIDGDVNAETVLSWLTDNGGDFGWEAPSTESDQDEVQAERISAATAAAPPAKTGTTADTLHKLRTLPYPELVAQGLVPGQ